MSDITTERLILSALLQSEEYARKVVHHLSPDYFRDEGEASVLRQFKSYFEKYDRVPPQNDITVALKRNEDISEGTTERAIEVLADVYDIVPSDNLEYLVDTTGEFVGDRAIFNAIQEVIEVYKDGQTVSNGKSITEILTDAMSVSMNDSVGHDYTEEAATRYDYYQSPVTKVPFDIEKWNEVTNGGVERKTLNIIIGGINVGKTMALSSMAAMYLKMGYNVYYSSSEISDMKIGNRIDANVLNMPMNEVRNIPREAFLQRFGKMRENGFGRLFVKDYPTGTCHAGHIRNDIREIKQKKKVKIDILLTDYLQIMTTIGPPGKSDSKYDKFKKVAEEIRAVCSMEDVVGWTAAQFNRDGLNNTDPGMKDTGESTGIPATADGMWALVRTDELDEIGQLLVIELKTRYGDKSKPKFCVGVNINTQRMYDIEEGEQRRFVTTREVPRPVAPPSNIEERASKAVANVNKFRNINVSNE